MTLFQRSRCSSWRYFQNELNEPCDWPCVSITHHEIEDGRQQKLGLTDPTNGTFVVNERYVNDEADEKDSQDVKIFDRWIQDKWSSYKIASHQSCYDRNN